MDLSGWFTPKAGPSVRFRAMTESQDLIDDYAEQVDTQLIVNAASVAIRDRKHVSLYKLVDHDSLPVWDCPIVVETGLARPPEHRSRWVLDESLKIWQGYCSGTLAVAQAKLSLDPKTFRAASVICGVGVFMFCLLFAIVVSSTKGGEQAAAPAAETQTTQTQTQEVDHGFVIEPARELEGPGGEPAESVPAPVQPEAEADQSASSGPDERAPAPGAEAAGGGAEEGAAGGGAGLGKAAGEGPQESVAPGPGQVP